MKAYMNHGRWVGDCPECNSAEELQQDQDFTCRIDQPGSQGLLGGCGYTEDVIWPEEIVDIDRILGRRPVANRNWYPHESLSDLRRENIVHGVGV